jgi:hypothetical protein
VKGAKAFMNWPWKGARIWATSGTLSGGETAPISLDIHTPRRRYAANRFKREPWRFLHSAFFLLPSPFAFLPKRTSLAQQGAYARRTRCAVGALEICNQTRCLKKCGTSRTNGPARRVRIFIACASTFANGRRSIPIPGRRPRTGNNRGAWQPKWPTREGCYCGVLNSHHNHSRERQPQPYA